MRKFFCSFVAFFTLSLMAMFSFAEDTFSVDATFEPGEIQMIGLPDTGEAAFAAEADRMPASPVTDNDQMPGYPVIATNGAAELFPSGGAVVSDHTSNPVLSLI